MKKMKFKLWLFAAVILALSVTFPLQAALEPTVVFLDTFENKTVGTTPTAPEIGYNWGISALAPSQVQVTENIGGRTDKCLVVRRALGGSSPSTTGFCLASDGTYEAGTMLVIKADHYIGAGPENQAEWYSTDGFYMHPSTGGGGFEAGVNTTRFPPNNNYRYVLPTGPNWSYQYINTGVQVYTNQWVTFEIDMYFEPNAPGTVGGTYDLYVTPEGGEKNVLIEAVPLRQITAVGIVRFGLWPDTPENTEWGGDVVNYWDNFSIEKTVIPQCGNMNHNFPLGDINEDCSVDLIDFSNLIADWLACTDVVCP